MVIRATSALVMAAAIVGIASLGSPPEAAGRDTSATPWTIKLKETQTREGGGSGTFELLGGNAADTDSGTVTFTQSVGKPGKTSDGVLFLAVARSETFKGKRGKFVIRSSVRVFGVGVLEQDDAVSSGTWSILRGTGRYAGLTGRGGLVGIVTAVPAGSECVGFSCYSHSYRYEGRVSAS
jgi:hypothetical protein